MRNALTSRSVILRALLAGLLAGASGGAFAQRHAPMARPPAWYPKAELISYPAATGQQQRPAPIERRPPPATQPPNGGAGQRLLGPNRMGGNGPKGEHLAEWMNRHSNLTLEQQQQALEREPGFHELPAQTQQRMRQRLSQLNAMSPLERQRILDRTEAMERLSPDQRTEVRGAMQRLRSLPPDQRQMVARSFRELRELPPDQRMAAMNSGRYRWMNEAQRSTLTNLIQVAPMLPPPQH